MVEIQKIELKQKQLIETLEFRDAASAGNSFMAADKFHKDVLKLQNEIFDLEQIVADKKKKENKPDIDRIIGAISSMPITIVNRIKNACEERLGKK